MRRGVVTAAAFLIKLAVLLQLRDHPLLQPHGELDTAYYVTLAQRLATEGMLAPTEAFFVSPLYVYFLALVFAVGGTLFTAQLVQIALGSVAVGLLFDTAGYWFGKRAALVAAALAILTGIFSFNEVLILQSALDASLVSCALHALTRIAAGGGPRTFAFAGVCLGLLALNRPNALVFALLAAAAVYVTQWRCLSTTERPRAWLNRGVISLATLIAVLGLNAARNYVVSGDFVVIASHGGLNLYIGNHDRADGTYTPVPGITPSIAGQAGDSQRVAESMSGRSLSPGEVSAFFARRAVDWVLDDPADAIRLTLRKMAILVNRVDVPLNYSYAFYAQHASLVLRVLAVGPWLLLPLGVIGLVWPLLREHRAGYWLWAMFVPVYGATVVLFFVTDRYRMPLFVPLSVTAGAALVRLFDLARARQLSALLVPAGAIAAAALVTFADLGLDNGLGAEQTRNAVWMVEQGATDEALKYVDRIASGHSHPGVLRFRVAQALLEAGEHAHASRLLAEAMQIDGPRPAIRLALGEALLRNGNATEAIPHLQAAYDADHDITTSAPLLIRALVLSGQVQAAIARLPQLPTSVALDGSAAADVALDFGTLALEHGATGEALRWLRIATEHAPDRAEAQEKLGAAIFLNGDAQSARPYLERAVRLQPGSPSAQLNLAAVYAQLGRFADAKNHALEALRLDPNETRAAALLEALSK